VNLHSRKWELRYEVDSRYYRPTEVEFLLGNPGKAKKTLGWESKVKFYELVKIMIKDDLNNLKKGGLG